jgi:hypothetical protein
VGEAKEQLQRVLLMDLGLITNILNNPIYSSEIIVNSLGLNDIFTSQAVHFCNVLIPSSLMQDQQQRGKNIVKRATQVHGHSLKLNFCLFERSQGKHNSLDCHTVFGIFSIN